jgi:diaminopimelate decarboxylase
MSTKNFPISDENLKDIIEKFSTPFHIYDEKAIVKNIKKLKDAFSWAEFKEYFAVKATPNPFIMKILQNEDIGADCSSIAELILAEKCGIVGENIMFTSNDTPVEEFKKATDLGAVINFDDIEHIKYFEENLGELPELVCFRYNPGSLKEGNAIIGHPEEAKYGFTREQLFEGYEYCKSRGVKRFGIHTMVASNELDHTYFIETAQILFDLIKEISQKIDISFEFANLGGGIGIPYKTTEEAVDIKAVGDGVKELYSQIIEANGLVPLKIYLEAGRMVTGPYGYLVSKVVHIKKTYKNYVGLDSSMANLMRPALYGAYHHITVVGKDESNPSETYDVVGSLCENNDKFAINRKLPVCEAGDTIIIHDTGAHGHSMGFSYNGKPRSAELLLRGDGSIKEIRRAENLNDIFATLDFNDLEKF